MYILIISMLIVSPLNTFSNSQEFDEKKEEVFVPHWSADSSVDYYIFHWKKLHSGGKGAMKTVHTPRVRLTLRDSSFEEYRYRVIYVMKDGSEEVTQWRCLPNIRCKRE